MTNISDENFLGKHLLGELYLCNPVLLDDQEFLKNCLEKAVRLAGAHLINLSFHKFAPQGVTGVALIKESHFSIHTWPENGYAAIDLFTCNLGMKTDLAFEFMVKSLECEEFTFKEIDRGLVKNSVNAKVVN